MKDFIYSMLGENGKVSSKRFIAIMATLLLMFVVIFTIEKPIAESHILYAEFVIEALETLIVLAASIATVAQITGIIKGIPQVPEPIKEALPTTEPTKTDPNDNPSATEQPNG